MGLGSDRTPTGWGLPRAVALIAIVVLAAIAGPAMAQGPNQPQAPPPQGQPGPLPDAGNPPAPAEQEEIDGFDGDEVLGDEAADWVRWMTTVAGGYAPWQSAEIEGLRLGTTIAALTLLGVFLTFAAIHYWASGTMNFAGGTEVVTAPLRAAGAGLFILGWYWLVSSGNYLVRSLSESLTGLGELDITGVDDGRGLGAGGEVVSAVWTIQYGLLGPGVNDVVDELLFTGVEGIVGVIVGALVTVAITLTMLALSASKIALDISFTALYVVMPLMMAIWVFPGLSWLSIGSIKAAVGFMAVPFGWAALLRVFSELVGPITGEGAGSIGSGALIQDYVGPGGFPGTFQEGFTVTLLAIVLIVLMFATMRQILRWAGVISQGSRPLGAAWGAALGLGFMAFRGAGMAFRGARSGLRAATGGGPQARRWAQQDARSWASDLRRSTAENQRTMNNAERQSQGALNRAQGIERNQHGEQRRTAAALDRQHERQQATQERAQTLERSTAERRNSDHARALREERQWSAPQGATRDGNRLDAPYANRVEAEHRGSDHRVAERGAPDVGRVDQAWSNLSPDQRQGVQDTYWGVPNGAQPHSSPDRAFAQAATVDGITPQSRDAYRTMLDASRRPESRAALELVTVGPTEQRASSSVPAGSTGNGAGGGP